LELKLTNDLDFVQVRIEFSYQVGSKINNLEGTQVHSEEALKGGDLAIESGEFFEALETEFYILVEDA
jgi:hypothetical protein